MHCLVEIKDDKYKIISTSENPNELTAGQSTNPLRIVLSLETIRQSLTVKVDREQLSSALASCQQLH